MQWIIGIIMLRLSLFNARYLLVELEESRPINITRKVLPMHTTIAPGLWGEEVVLPPPGWVQEMPVDLVTGEYLLSKSHR